MGEGKHCVKADLVQMIRSRPLTPWMLQNEG